MSPSWSLQTRYLVVILLLLLVAAFLFVARAMVAPLVMAALLAYVLEPAVTFLTKRARMRRRLAVTLVYLVFLGILISVPAVFTPVVIDELSSLDEQLRGLVTRVGESMQNLNIFGLSLGEGEFPISAEPLLTGLLVPEQIFGVLQSATENLVWLIVIFITAYYILVDWERLRRWVFHLVPEPYRPDAQRLYKDLRDVWQRYLRGQLLSMTLIGLLSGIGAAAVGLPGAVIFGLLGGALGVLPSVGSSTMAVIAPIVALFTGSTYMPLSNFWFAVVVAGVFVAIHILENYWLRPRILGQGLKLHPGLVIVGVIGALTLGGVLIALIIAPIIRSADILGRYALRRVMDVSPWPDDGSSAAS